ncbi:DUF3617 domain-containing protein [Sphingomonas sp. M1-B02]|uniref:DUF3617 domain-containing protein n=1 Tax=Sphingomonas sp. M1-B02 TaxID=3114300 RepID=UPI00223FD8FD|nr:DUF3617 family protein [Sphingomonas sp. S6-11]UZK65812.1 DUF3617 domain-containing protein [Sphingomonas sp. S6-11]
MRASVLIAALALAGCQSAEEKHAADTGEIKVVNADIDQVAGLLKAAAPKTAVKPGLWKAELRIEDVQAGANSAAQLRAAKALERTTTECRTAEQLKPFDIEKLEKAAGTCTFLRFNSGAGQVDAHIKCSKFEAPVTEIFIKGTTSSTQFDVATENRSGVAGQPNYAVVKMRSTGTRVGDCKG